MNPKILVLPVAAGLTLGGAALATGAPDPPERPALVKPGPAFAMHAAPIEFPGAHPFGLHKEIADDMAKELGLPAEKVASAMKKAIGAQFDRRRDEALQCFEDREKCKAVAHLPPFVKRHAMPVPVQPGRTTKP